eukprot:scaffold102435_cov37-Prasinocladus_malaysianus.AAC.1
MTQLATPGQGGWPPRSLTTSRSTSSSTSAIAWSRSRADHTGKVSSQCTSTSYRPSHEFSALPNSHSLSDSFIHVLLIHVVASLYSKVGI